MRQGDNELQGLQSRPSIHRCKRGACAGFFVSVLLFATALKAADYSATVSIVSTPPHASVFLDNRFIGVSPVSVAGVGFGNHLLVVTRHGYHPVSRILYVARATMQVRVVLKAIEGGILKIVAKPEEAKVFLNEDFKGKTPITLENLAAGKYHLRLEADGYFVLQDTVEVKAKELTTVEKTLESKSEAYLLNAIAKEPHRVAHYYDLAHYYCRVQQFDKAFEMFAKGYDACVHPDVQTNEQRRLYDELERVWDGQYDFADAPTRISLQPRIIEELEKAIQRQPRNVLNYWALGLFHQKKGDWGKAAEAYEKGFRAVQTERARNYLEANLATARFHQARGLEQSGKLEEALALYESLVKEHPRAYATRNAVNQIAAIWHNYKRDYRKGIEWKQRFITMFPDSDQCPALQMEIAGMYVNSLKDYEKAIEAYRTYIRSYPEQDNCVSAQMLIASTYRWSLKDVQGAIREYEKVVREYPNSDSAPVALRALFELYWSLANVSPDGDKAKEKAEDIRKRLLTDYAWSGEAAILENDPPSQELRQEAANAFSRATALVRTDVVKAIAAYEEVVLKYPRFSQAREAQVQIINLYANRFKDNAKANQARLKYVELFPDSDQSPSMLYQAGYNLAYVLKQYEEGVAVLRRLQEAYPESDLCLSAQSSIANIYSFSYGHYDRERNVEENRRLIQMFPWYDGNDVVQTAIGLNYFYQFEPGDKQIAQRELLKSVQDYPHGSHATQTEYYLDLIDAGMQMDENRLLFGEQAPPVANAGITDND